jgi:hypothetical protein
MRTTSLDCFFTTFLAKTIGTPLPPSGPIAGKERGLKTEEVVGSLLTILDRENGVSRCNSTVPKNAGIIVKNRQKSSKPSLTR